MRRIFLTINVSAHDICFDYLSDILKININDIPSLKKNPSDFEKLRCDAVSEAIFESEKDMLLGWAIQDKIHLEALIRLLKPKKMAISRIYFDNGSRREKAGKEYREMYGKHSNMMDYAPEFIAYQNQLFNEKILDIEKAAIKNNIVMLSV